MNEEFRLFTSFESAYKRLEEIKDYRRFLIEQISIYGENVTAKEMLKNLTKEEVDSRNNMLEYFKKHSYMKNHNIEIEL